jgi:hypothetical protein
MILGRKEPIRRGCPHVRGGFSMEQGWFPKFDYHLDESDPDILVLRRQDGAFVAAFSARGATREGIVEAAQEDYQALLARLPKEGKRRRTG